MPRSAPTPRTTVLDLVGGEHFPDEVSSDMRSYRSRGGSVKINCILSEPPAYAGDHTACGHFALMEGAIRSGRRAARSLASPRV